MEGLFLELSDFAAGSNELRCRVVGPGRLARQEAAEQGRMVAAAEGGTRAGKVAAGAAVVSAVAAVVTVAIIFGSANPATYRLVNQYNVRHIYVRAPEEQPHVVSKSEIEQGRRSRLSAKGKTKYLQRTAENDALVAAMNTGKPVYLAGWFYHESPGGRFFETMNGNHFPVYFSDAGDYGTSPVALRAVVSDSARGPCLDGIEVIAELSDY